jgi:hypothetical protein
MGSVAVVSFALAACQAATGLVSPPAPVPMITPSNGAPTGEANASVDAGSLAPEGQTDTAWGRIWDSLPADFPSYPGSTPADQAATGPASAVLAVPGTDARTIAAWMQSQLEHSSYRTEALSGPLEDGSFVLDSTGPTPGCRIQISVAPLGGLTITTVRYGASCRAP